MLSKKQAAPEGLYQLKVTLLDIHPPIWRRIQVQNCTLETLHDVIQIAMGWENYHMHQFIVGKTYYGIPDESGFDQETVDEATVLLSQLAPPNKRKVRFIYEYDFGDSWRHEVMIEKCPAPSFRTVWQASEPVRRKTSAALGAMGNCSKNSSCRRDRESTRFSKAARVSIPKTFRSTKSTKDSPNYVNSGRRSKWSRPTSSTRNSRSAGEHENSGRLC